MIADALPPQLQVFYDAGRKCYLTKNSRGGWIDVSESSIRKHLRQVGFSPECGRKEMLSSLDTEIVRIQRECDVAYAGPLAGYAGGITELYGNRILVTGEPTLIDPVPGEWPLIDLILSNLFNDPIRDQRPFLYGWIKVSYEARRANQLRPGQAVAMAGPHGCGKSLVQTILTKIFGGRAAKPYRYMSGATDFNADLFGAEHLMVEDEIASTSMAQRRNFGSRIKELTVNEMQSCHAKGRGAVSLRPFWRLSITLNDEPENLLILPPIDESLADKIILLKAHKQPMPMPTATLDQRQEFIRALEAEIPAFLSFLVNWEIPDELQSERFGVTHYHHPDLLSAIDALSGETRLLSIIDSAMFSTPVPGTWRGTAEELARVLFESSFSYEAKSLLNWPNAAGTYLGRLAKAHPQRIEQDRTPTRREWVIRPAL